MNPDQRREQLVDVAARLFADQPYDDVTMEQVSERAGVSRALLYRHFPAKRDLFAAVYRRAADDLIAHTEPDRGTPVADWIAAGLDTHLDYFAANTRTVLAANRDLAADPVIQDIIAGELRTLHQRALDSIGLPEPQRDVVSVLLLAWLSFVRTLCVEWLANPVLSRAELREVCLRCLRATLGSAVDL